MAEPLRIEFSGVVGDIRVKVGTDVERSSALRDGRTKVLRVSRCALVPAADFLLPAD